MHRFLADGELAAQAALVGTAAVKTAVDGVLAQARAAIAKGDDAPVFGVLLTRALARLEREAAGGLTEAVNATGVLLHTNLGRAPLAAEALAAIAQIAGGFSNLEFDLASGARDSRYARVSGLVRAVTGAADALVVNNCAAAMLLILDTFARSRPGEAGREVVVMRNEMIEIGGGFRLPEVLERSGATLVEAGTTNKVYLRDVARALGPRTALLLRSHASNYRIEGFTAEVAPAELAALGRRAEVPAVEDLGSGALLDLRAFGLPHERTVQEALRDGFELVAFSGDKLLGGPQAGIIAGGAAAIARLRANPLLRALRVDKATLAALGATLRLYLEPDGPAKIPLYAMLGATCAALRVRAAHYLAGLAAGQGTVRETTAFLGGGSAPLAPLPSIGLALRDPGGSATALASRLRGGTPPVVARIEDGAVIVDLRTVPPARDAEVAAAVAAALGPAG
jgi:L-seryl-tRNA(Ser) seleniumtransferase